MVIDGGVLVFWDDQILQISKKHYGTFQHTGPLQMLGQNQQTPYRYCIMLGQTFLGNV